MAVAFSLASSPAGVAGSGSTVTYTDCAIGTAAADRIVAVCVTSKDNTATAVANVTIGGVTASRGAGGNDAGHFGSMYSAIFHQLFPTGTTATIVVTYNSTAPAAANNHITTYAVTGADPGLALSGTASSTDMDANNPLNFVLSIPTGGGALGVACGSVATTGAKAWTNMTENEEVSVGYCHTSATTTTATASVTCTGGTNNEDGAMAVVVFKPTVTWNRWAGDDTGVARETRRLILSTYNG